MPMMLSRLCRAAVPLALMAVPAMAQPAVPAMAQPAAPAARNANEWGGLEHEPNPAQVLQGERRAGIAGTPQQQQRENDEVEQLNRQVQEQAKRDLSGPIAPAP